MPYEIQPPKNYFVKISRELPNYVLYSVMLYNCLYADYTPSSSYAGLVSLTSVYNMLFKSHREDVIAGIIAFRAEVKIG